MKKRSFRPSPAMIVACVALFVALGGTATAVTYVVSSNSQIGPGTVSGHNPPTGKHANIIGGSVNANDLAAGAVTHPKLGPNAVGGSSVLDNSLHGADVGESTLDGSQITGVDAATLGGKTATDFAPAGALHTVRMPVNDPTPGDNNSAQVTLLDTGTAQITGLCLDDRGVNNTDLAEIDVSLNSSSLSSEASDGLTENVTDTNGARSIVSFSAPNASNTDQLESAHFVTLPGSGPPLSGLVSAELNDVRAGGSDCTFTVNAIGG
jgi:hypothetical protein